MNIYPFKAACPNVDLIASTDSFFENIGSEYINFKASGFFKTLDTDAMFIYCIEGNSSFTGLIASNDINDIASKKILGHENTITAKEQTMMQLMMVRKAMIKPVLLAYNHHAGIDEFISHFMANNPPLFEINFEKKVEKHCIWKISLPQDINSLQQLFKLHVNVSFIADGHHRASVTADLIRKQYLDAHEKHPGLLCVFFPFRDLEIFDYNRLLALKGKITKARFVSSVSEYADIKFIKHPKKPSKKHEMTMIIDGEWFLVKWKKKAINKYKLNDLALDVDLFNKCILDNILHIKDSKVANEISYVEGVLGVEGMETSLSTKIDTIGFCLFPVSKEDMIKTSENGDVLPPKSTWFEPRMKNGMIIKEF